MVKRFWKTGLMVLSAFSTALNNSTFHSSKPIYRMLIKEFLISVFIAAVTATPVSWLLMNKWLQGFAYREPVNVWLFVATTISVLLLSVLTMGFQSVRAARANPIKSLRTE